MSCQLFRRLLLEKVENGNYARQVKYIYRHHESKSPTVSDLKLMPQRKK